MTNELIQHLRAEEFTSIQWVKVLPCMRLAEVRQWYLCSVGSINFHWVLRFSCVRWQCTDRHDTASGLPGSGKNIWKMKLFPGQEKVREFCGCPGKLRKDLESQGI